MRIDDFWAGALLSAGCFIALITLWIVLVAEPYEFCEEDEVWSWHMNYEPDYPNDVRWECVAVDDLLMEHNP